jgi:hypothetical protein
MNINEALHDKRLLGAALGDPASWSTWIVILKAAFALPLSESERGVFADVAGGRSPPTKIIRELWAIAGRRGGKSRMAAALAVYFACFAKYKSAPGERLMVLVLSMSLEQSRSVFGYALAFLQESPALAKEVLEITRTEIRLRNGIVIAIHSNSFRAIKGRTLCACIFDEVAMWRDIESAVPDQEVYSAVLPALLTTRGMLIGVSTGYRRLGLLFQKYRDYFGQDSDDTLVVQGSTLQFNGTLDEVAIAAQRAADPTAASAEWDGTFRDDISGFLDDATVDAAIDNARPLELPYRSGTVYVAFTDPAGGGGNPKADSYTLAIGHRQPDGIIVIDVVRGTPAGKKYDTQEVTEVYARLCREYRCRTVVGDAYGKDWVAGSWRKAPAGVGYEQSERVKSDIYLESEVAFTRERVRLPPHPILTRELRLLEKHAARSGKPDVTHPKNCHDDYANACCGVIALLASSPPAIDWRRGLEMARRMPADPKYAQHRTGHPMLLRHAQFQLGERRAAQLACGIIPGRKPEP